MLALTLTHFHWGQVSIFWPPTQAYWKTYEQRIRQLQRWIVTEIVIIDIWLCLDLETYFYNPPLIFLLNYSIKSFIHRFLQENKAFFVIHNPWIFQIVCSVSKLDKSQWIAWPHTVKHMMSKSIIIIKIHNHHLIIYICLI